MTELPPESSGDERDEGWNEPAYDEEAALAGERPPHHDRGW